MLSIRTFKLPGGREINLSEIKRVSEPKMDWKIFFANILRKSESYYFEIELLSGIIERVYCDRELVRYRTLMLFLSENNRMDVVQ
jgi:hypothetical protein